jgi:hypothetical protein
MQGKATIGIASRSTAVFQGGESLSKTLPACDAEGVVDLFEVAVQDHFGSFPPHGGEVGGEGRQASENDLVQGKFIV